MSEAQPFMVLTKTETGGIECQHAVDFAPADDARLWGIALADAVRHIARGRSQHYGDDEHAVINQVMTVFVDEVKMQLADPRRGNLSGGIVQ